MKKIVKLVAIIMVAMFVKLEADDHFLTLPVIGSDIEVEHAWYYHPDVGGGLHQAIDYTRLVPGAIEGQNILASYGGIVVHITNDVPNNTNPPGQAYGNYVKIDHDNGYETLYAHCLCNSIPLNVGDYVYQGQIIGQVGITGLTSGAHLHFELIYNGEKIDPYGWYTYPNTPNTYPNCNPDEYYWMQSPPAGPPNVNSDRQLPNDLLVHVLGTPDYCYLENDLMCKFDCEYPFYTWGFEWDEAVDISQDEFSDFLIGPDVEVMPGAGVYDQNYQRWVFDYSSDTSPVIVKRKATNWSQLGYAVDIWIPVSNDFMAQFNQGSELLNVSDYPYGAVLQNQNNLSQRYVLVNGSNYGMPSQKMKIPLFSNDAYHINYYHHNFNVLVSNSALANFPTINGVCSMIRDGKLISGSGAEIYYLENGQKRKIVDANSFIYYGFDYANVHEVSNADIDIFPNGADIFFSPSGGAAYAGGELEDGGFDSGLSAYWNFFDWQEVADFDVTANNSISGVFKAEVDVFSSVNSYDVELKQLVEVENEALYHFSFWIKSIDQMPVTIALQNDNSPWNNYGLWKEISTSGDWSKYQYVFTANGFDDLARLSFQVGQSTGHLYLDQVVFEKIEEILPPTGNLLANGDFELGHYAPYQVEDHNSTASYYTDELESYHGQYSLFIDPNQNGEFYQVQLKQIVEVEEDQEYQLSFWAKAQTERTVLVELCQDVSPWTNYGLWEEISISPGWNLYQIEFTTDNVGTARLAIHLGNQDIALWLDDISLLDSFSIADNPIETGNVSLWQNYPNPFETSTSISYSLLEFDCHLLIYNIKGQIVQDFLLDNSQNSILWSGNDQTGFSVPSGVYFYQIKGSTIQSSVKKMLFLK